MSIVPYVLEETGRGERSMDVYSRLLVDRIIIVGDELNDQHVNVIIAQLLFLSNDSDKDIQMYINMKRGSLSAGVALYDAIKFISTKCDIATICIGQATSVGALILASGSKGKRMALPNSRIMIHQPLGRVGGTSSDIVLQAKEWSTRKAIVIKVLAECTGQSEEKISNDIDRDFFMSSKDAIDYGIIDKICTQDKVSSNANENSRESIVSDLETSKVST